MTTVAEPGRLQELVKGLKVIDADTHFTEPPDLWTSRAPARFKDLVPHIRNVNGEDIWFVEGDKEYSPVGPTVVTAAGDKVTGRVGLATFEELSHAAYDVTARLALMDRLGIHAAIVYPNAVGFSALKLMAVSDPELRLECVRIYNDAVAEWQAASNNRLFPQALIPFWDLKESIREIRRCIDDLHLTGLALTDRPEACGMPDYGTNFWDPFWDFCNDIKVPLNFHVGSGGQSALYDSPWPSVGPEKKIAIGATMIYLDNARMVTNLLFSGLFDRFPNLKFVSVESGISWIPFVLEAAEYQFDEMLDKERADFKARPTEYFKKHIYACFWFEDYGPRHMLELVGVNNIMFETDFPHPTCLYPRAQEHVANVLQDISPEIRRRIMQDNAIELYKLPIATSGS